MKTLTIRGGEFLTIRAIVEHLERSGHMDRIEFNRFHGCYSLKDAKGELLAEIYAKPDGLPRPDDIPHVACALDEMDFDSPEKMAKAIRAGTMVAPTAISDPNDPLLKLLKPAKEPFQSMDEARAAARTFPEPHSWDDER